MAATKAFRNCRCWWTRAPERSCVKNRKSKTFALLAQNRVDLRDSILSFRGVAVSGLQLQALAEIHAGFIEALQGDQGLAEAQVGHRIAGRDLNRGGKAGICLLKVVI